MRYPSMKQSATLAIPKLLGESYVSLSIRDSPFDASF